MTITVPVDCHMDAALVWRKATGWLVSEIGNLLLGGDSVLISPERGMVGKISAGDVDAAPGEVLSDDRLTQGLIKRGRQVARATLSSPE